ncbi:UNVERIFIED_CONTAM: protein MAINTENANCE OF MERISTEMS [Sesamum calycinum]|uniref:Protein MAINTENANCE OF MERISTEMS n=1 Tax=Sesamum calycinum TaxID=2727403 RepID=A0AAW2JAZ9_9LAMI
MDRRAVYGPRDGTVLSQQSQHRSDDILDGDIDEVLQAKRADDGEPVSATDLERTSVQWQEYCMQYIGFAPEEGALKGSQLQYARVVALLLLGGTMCPNSSGNLVSLLYLAKLENIVAARNYSWGSAVLAFLYRELCNASEKGKAAIGGALQLVQSRIIPLCPRLGAPRVHMGPHQIDNNRVLPRAPYGAMWNCEHTFTQTVRSTVRVIRDILDEMQYDQPISNRRDTDRGYWEWYNNITRHFVSSSTDRRVESGYQPGDAPVLQIVTQQVNTLQTLFQSKPVDVEGYRQLVAQLEHEVQIIAEAIKHQPQQTATPSDSAPTTSHRQRRSSSQMSIGSVERGDIGVDIAGPSTAYTPQDYYVPQPPQNYYVPQPSQDDWFQSTSYMPSHAEAYSSHVDLDLGLGINQPYASEYNISPVPFPSFSAYRDNVESSSAAPSSGLHINSDGDDNDGQNEPIQNMGEEIRRPRRQRHRPQEKGQAEFDPMAEAEISSIMDSELPPDKKSALLASYLSEDEVAYPLQTVAAHTQTNTTQLSICLPSLHAIPPVSSPIPSFSPHYSLHPVSLLSSVALLLFRATVSLQGSPRTIVFDRGRVFDHRFRTEEPKQLDAKGDTEIALFAAASMSICFTIISPPRSLSRKQFLHFSPPLQNSMATPLQFQLLVLLILISLFIRFEPSPTPLPNSHTYSPLASPPFSPPSDPRSLTTDADPSACRPTFSRLFRPPWFAGGHVPRPPPFFHLGFHPPSLFPQRFSPSAAPIGPSTFSNDPSQTRLAFCRLRRPLFDEEGAIGTRRPLLQEQAGFRNSWGKALLDRFQQILGAKELSSKLLTQLWAEDKAHFQGPGNGRCMGPDGPIVKRL